MQFIQWVKSFQTLLNTVIAIDGKTLSNSFATTAASPAIHMVSAFATDARLVLAQQKVAEKSNAVVWLFLETELKQEAAVAIDSRSEAAAKGHGCIAMRRCIVSSQIAWLKQQEQWSGLKTLVMIEETREIKNKISTARRFFISILPAAAVRSHWLLENGLHWTLDGVCNEANSRVRTANAGENMAVSRHMAINMLNKAKILFKNVSLKALRNNAGLEKRYA